MVSGGTVTSASSSGVASSVSSPVCGADAWHVGSLRHYLQEKGTFSFCAVWSDCVVLNEMSCLLFNSDSNKKHAQKDKAIYSHLRDQLKMSKMETKWVL